MIPGKDRVVEIREDDLLHILHCALNQGSRIPFGIPPERVWEVLSEEGKQWIWSLRGDNPEG